MKKYMGGVLYLALLFMGALNSGGCSSASGSTTPQAGFPSYPTLMRVAPVRQATEYTCGVASLMSVLRYYGITNLCEDRLAIALGTDPERGTSYQKIVEYSNAQGIYAVAFNNMTIEQLQACLDNKQPVIVAYQAWKDNPSIPYQDDWVDGHFSVVIGYDSTYVYFMDPLTLGNYTSIPTGEFLTRWHNIDDFANEKLNNFGIVYPEEGANYNPDAIMRTE